ncbi:ABC transporter ATP-binding protein [Oceanospirillum sediminis]|uniref:ABC transporter ATP-binding protein n=1 Tax=Oceanospirillum sediminis TaxID=2760088 RepID=A0A839IP66_9GAMM|nr:ABC transporter ATP-binding protein [Oceanospirillum sediminis]MBB1486289.1 ABC transporter ATP-binding protein [Oceanospirillum sediminis]
MSTLLQVDAIECRYDQLVITRDISFSLNQGDICCLLGPSGCGKTTLLRTIAGFDPVYSGSISLNGSIISSPDTLIEPEERRIGMVFQDYALFPHLTIRENIAFGLRKLSKQEKGERVTEMLDLVNMRDLIDRYPHELSGGQQQRVALARALAPRPQMILLDEPFSNLDSELRKHLGLEVRRILKSQNISGVLVTHDQTEAFAMADYVGVLNQGRMQQWDTPYNLYHEPANQFVANFVGQGYLIPGQLQDHNKVSTEVGIIEGNRAYPWADGTDVDVLLRPDDIIENPSGSITAIVDQYTFAGSATHYRLRLPSGLIVESMFNSHAEYDIGDPVRIEVKADHLILFNNNVKDNPVSV